MACCCSVSLAVGMNINMTNTLSYSNILAFDRNPKVSVSNHGICVWNLNNHNHGVCVHRDDKQVLFSNKLSSKGPHLVMGKIPVGYVSPSMRLSQIDVSVTDMKDIGATLRKSNVVIESSDQDTIQVRVDLTGKDTQKVFDDVLTNLARTAPAVPGFRKTKGGKMSNVPRDFLVRAIGEARIIKFVIQEIVSIAMTEYVEEATLKVKKEFKTIQTPEELESQFEPGKPFVFNATLDIDKSETETPRSEIDV